MPQEKKRPFLIEILVFFRKSIFKHQKYRATADLMRQVGEVRVPSDRYRLPEWDFVLLLHPLSKRPAQEHNRPKSYHKRPRRPRPKIGHRCAASKKRRDPNRRPYKQNLIQPVVVLLKPSLPNCHPDYEQE